MSHHDGSSTALRGGRSLFSVVTPFGNLGIERLAVRAAGSEGAHGHPQSDWAAIIGWQTDFSRAARCVLGGCAWGTEKKTPTEPCGGELQSVRPRKA